MKVGKSMGKERDRLIRSLGGIPINDLNLTDAEILQFARDTYWERGEIPPDIRRMLDEMKQENSK
ncbi:hypothetical protein B1H10_05845 [candidate division KSB1 bacterium 4484_188]|nr:MAG: hypothetical protein B1H10_05845 [candidate division KSB1 bacterium 4484_188]